MTNDIKADLKYTEYIATDIFIAVTVDAFPYLTYESVLYILTAPP